MFYVHGHLIRIAAVFHLDAVRNFAKLQWLVVCTHFCVHWRCCDLIDFTECYNFFLKLINRCFDGLLFTQRNFETLHVKFLPNFLNPLLHLRLQLFIWCYRFHCQHKVFLGNISVLSSHFLYFTQALIVQLLGFLKMSLIGRLVLLLKNLKLSLSQHLLRWKELAVTLSENNRP